MANYQFDKDLLFSKTSVNKVKEYLESIGATDITENDDSRFDLYCKINDKKVTVEVKNDLWYHITGNVAIETESRGKESGVTTSKAKIWCYVLDRGVGYDGLYFTPLSKLKKHLTENKYPEKPGGDRLTSKVILMPITRFTSVFEKKTRM